MIRSPRSLQARLLVLVLSVVTMVWLATSALTWFDVRHELEELLDGHLAQAAALLVVQQAQGIEDDGQGIDAPTLHRYAPKVAFQVFHEDRLAMRSANAPLAPMVESSRRLESGFSTVQISGAAWRMFAARGAERDVQVYVGEQMSSRDAILWAVLRSTFVPMMVALPLLALALWWAVHRGVQPIRRLGHALAERQPQALVPVAIDNAPAEMTPMIAALNSLFERIARLLESERRFTADAAHELRTPIAAIRMQAQVAMLEADDALRLHALQSTLEGCDRATRLVGQLLSLSRLEAGEGIDAAARPDVDLRALAQRMVAELAPKAIGKHQSLEFKGSDHCVIAGNDTLLAALVRNLVDNAVRYSPNAARIRVTVQQQQGGQVVLSVEDSGPGLGEADRQRLGERFFRVVGSGESGSGLGWSIVRRIAAVQHLTVDVGNSAALGGLAVHIIYRK